MNLRRSILLPTLAAFALTISGCGGSSNTPPPATVTVSLTGQPASLAPGAPASITATVSNGAGVTWSVTCATSPCGSFNPASTASGAATVYTAPASPTSVTITATTSSGTTAANSATITIAAPAISVTIVNPPSSIAAGATANLTATVANDTANAGVNWTVTCSSSSCGSFNPTKTASGSATVYTAPAAIPTSGTVTITATSVTDPTKTNSASITITAPGISVALNPTPPTSLLPGATTNLVAVVSNDSKNGGVTWSVTCGSSGACGSFSAASTPSGTATIYSAPTAIPTNNTVTITATSVTDTTKTASATITITNILANGTYVYHFYGYDSTGPSFFVGAFTVANGAITGGEQDFSDASTGYALDSISASGSSITTAGGNIQVVLATSNSNLGVGGIETLRGTVVSGSRVLISEFDTFGTATGSIDLQTSTAGPSGGYAFAVTGLDIESQGNLQAALGGILNISGSSLNINGSVFDVNVSGTVEQALTFSSGSVSAPDSFGRVTFSLTPSANTGIPEILLTGYIVGANQIMLVESQGSSTTLNDDLGGMALGQGSNTGNFNQASVANKTYVFQGSGQDVNLFVNMGGTFVFGTGVSGTLALNDGTVFNVTNFSGATYAVDTTGRVSINGVSSPISTTTPLSFQLYLDGNGNALELGVDTVEVTEGPAFLQSATGDFEGSYAIVGNGYLNATGVPFFGAVGPVTVASDTFSGSTDYNYLGATPISAQALTGTETSSSATLNLIGIDATSFTSSRTYSYFRIDSKRVFAVETDGNQIGLITLEGH
jgi:hypothetical protein